MKNFVPVKLFNKDEYSFKKMLLKPYSIPNKKDLLVIVPFFNPCNSIRMTQNLLLVKSKLEHADIQHVVIHCLFPDNPKLMKENTNYIVVNSSSYIFAKENMANIVIAKNIDKYEKFMVLDGDIIFEKDTWYDDTSSLLCMYDIIQPYNVYNTLSSSFDIIASGLGAFSQDKGHPGYAIAFTKFFWEVHGLPDICLLGGGDTVLCSIIKKHYASDSVQSLYHSHVFNKYLNEIQIKYSYLKGKVYHLYHNHTTNRQYSSRYLILNKYITSNRTIDDIIYKNKDGVYEWVDEIKENVNKDILNYFTSRKDDN